MSSGSRRYSHAVAFSWSPFGSERSVADASSSPFVTIARSALGSVWGPRA
jgi:hypothetical protein